MSSNSTVTFIQKMFKVFVTKVTLLPILMDGHPFLLCSIAAN